jgi:hypothetical protein
MPEAFEGAPIIIACAANIGHGSGDTGNRVIVRTAVNLGDCR